MIVTSRPRFDTESVLAASLFLNTVNLTNVFARKHPNRFCAGLFAGKHSFTVGIKGMFEFHSHTAIDLQLLQLIQ